jgi:multiple sugar transport system ATP-binding protein
VKDKSTFETSLGSISAHRKISFAEAGEAALLGIRPSDIRVAAKGESAIDSTVQLLEPLGDVTIVSVAAGDETLRIVLPESGAIALRPGQHLPIHLDPKKFHIFRASSGQALA